MLSVLLKKIFDPVVIPPNLSDRVDEQLTDITLSAAKAITLLGAILVPLSLGFDYLIAGTEHLLSFFIIRLFISCCCYGLYLLTKKDTFRKRGNTITFLTLVIGGICFNIMIAMLEDNHPYYAVLVLLYLASMLVPWGPKMAFFCCLSIYGSYVLPIIFFYDRPFQWWLIFNNNGFQIETIIIAVLVSHFQYKLQVKGILNRLVIEDESKKLTKANETIQTMVKAFTHDIKNKLAGAEMTLNAYQSKVEGEDDRHLLHSILEIKRASLNSVNQMNLLVSQTDQLALKKESVALRELGEKLKEGWGKIFLSRGIDFVVDLPDHCVSVDKEYMGLVWENLAANAFKHTPSGGIFKLWAEVLEDAIELRFMNSGNLIPEEERKTLFSEDKTSAYKNPYNKGFGLSFSKMIVERHGGSIDYQVIDNLNVFVVKVL